MATLSSLRNGIISLFLVTALRAKRENGGRGEDIVMSSVESVLKENLHTKAQAKRATGGPEGWCPRKKDNTDEVPPSI
jgi:hypothetical protein